MRHLPLTSVAASTLLVAGLLVACTNDPAPSGPSTATGAFPATGTAPVAADGTTAAQVHVDPTAPGGVAFTPDPQRSIDTVFTILNGISGRTVADLGAGDGYNTWSLLRAGANVIAIDEDPANIAAIEARKKELGLSDARLRTRVVSPGECGLNPNEVDLALITRPYMTIPNKPAYFASLRQGVSGVHQVAIVNHLNQNTASGPPMDQRMSEIALMDELGNFGYADVLSLTKALPDRYLVVAQDLPPEAY